MKQLYFTSCVAGKSVGGQSGYNVRAVTPGTDAGQLTALRRLTTYKVPDGVAEAADPAQLPARLALLDVAGAGRVLLHAAYVGADPTTGRMGNFFCHALLDVPPAVDARAAALMWKHRFWRTRDGDFSTDLPDEPALPAADARALNGRLADFLREGSPGCELFQFALQGLLTAPPDHRLFVVAPAEQVALCVYGLSRALPRARREALTFSTYEKEPLQFEARVVGTWWAPSAPKELPSACYDGNALAFNTYNRRASAKLEPCEYVKFATERLASGGAELDTFVAWYDRLKPVAGRQVDEVFRLCNNGTATRPELLRGLDSPELAAKVAARPNLAANVVRDAMEDEAFRQGDFHRFVALLGAAGGRAALEGSAVTATKAAIGPDRDPARARVALEQVLPVVSSGRTDEVWAWVAGEVAPASLRWELRAYLSEARLLKSAPKGGADRLSRWGDVEAKDLNRFLALDVAPEWKVRACQAHAGNDAAVPVMATVLAGQLALFLKVLDRLAPPAARPGDPNVRRAAGLFQVVAKQVRPADLLAALQGCPDRLAARDPLTAALEPTKLAAELHLSLARRLLTKKQGGDGEVLARWAHVPAGQLAALLQDSAIHRDWKVCAYSACHSRPGWDPSAEVKQALGQDPSLLFAVLADLTGGADPKRDANRASQAAALFVAAARTADGRGLVGALLSRPDGLPVQVCDGCLYEALAADLADADRLLKDQDRGGLFARLLPPPQGRAVLLIAEQLLARKLDSLSKDAAAMAFLTDLVPFEKHLKGNARERLASLIGLNTYLARPPAERTKREHLEHVAGVLRNLPPNERDDSRHRMIGALAESLPECPTGEAQTRLLDTLAVLGDAAAASPTELYERLVDTLLYRWRFWPLLRRYRRRLSQRPDLIAALLAVGFGEGLAGRRVVIDEDRGIAVAGALVHEARRMPPAVAEAVEKKLKTGSPEARKLYQSAAAGRPLPPRGLRGLLARLRDPWLLMSLVVVVVLLLVARDAKELWSWFKELLSW